MASIIKDDSLKIGVFICHCGKNIAGYLDTDTVAQYATKLPGVVFVSENHYSCSEPGIQEIKRAITEHQLNRVVVAACTPRTHEPLFRKTCEEAGLNKYLFEFVNIREQCSWVHSKDRPAATAKAKDLVRMGVAKAALLEPAEEIEVEVEKAALVIGGGVSGITAAVSLARRGFPVTLVEQEDELGGRLRDLHMVLPAEDKAEDYRQQLINSLSGYDDLNVMTGSKVTSVNGFLGNFEVEISRGKEKITRTVGTILVATGADVLLPTGIFNFDGKRVITQLELESKLLSEDFQPKSLAMIQCAGARIEERPYCSKICCFTALKNSLILKRRFPDMEITILFRDLQTHGVRYERFLNEAREAGVKFVQYSLEQPPVIKDNQIRTYDNLLERELEIQAEMVILSTPLIPRPDTREMSKLLRVPVSETGFLLEAHAQLRPVEFATDGIYLCGAALWPADITESIFQAQAAASKASIPMQQGTVRVEPVTCSVEPHLCRACGLCVSICEYHAPEIVNDPSGLNTAVINEAICKGCGTCAAMCPTNAITARQFTDKQLMSMMETALSDWQAPVAKE